MADKIFIQIPHDVTDIITLKRFLAKLIQEIDGVFTNAKDSLEASIDNLSSTLSASIDEVKEELSQIDISLYIKKDGTVDFTDIISYDTTKTFTASNNLINKKYVDDEVARLESLISSLESRVTALESVPPPE